MATRNQPQGVLHDRVVLPGIHVGLVSESTKRSGSRHRGHNTSESESSDTPTSARHLGHLIQAGMNRTPVCSPATSMQRSQVKLRGLEFVHHHRNCRRMEHCDVPDHHAAKLRESSSACSSGRLGVVGQNSRGGPGKGKKLDGSLSARVEFCRSSFLAVCLPLWARRLGTARGHSSTPASPAFRP
jgi:hypothetical protein